MAKKNRQVTPIQKSGQGKERKPSGKEKIYGNSKTRNWLLPLFLVLGITAFCYLPAIRNQYVNLDDEVNITLNPNLEHLNWDNFKNIFSFEKGNVAGNYNPLSIATFFVEKIISGSFNPTLSHSLNILLHLCVVFLVFRLMLLMGIRPWGAFIGGLLFGIHPMRVESVAWATERKDVLFAIFFFAALVQYVHWIRTEDADKKKRIYFLMILLCALSCLSKVQAVSLPLAMLTLDYWFKRPLQLQRIWEKFPFWIMSLGIGIINLITLRAAGTTDDTVTNYSFLERLLVGTYSFCTYLYKLIIPYPMSPLYPYEKELPALAYISPIGFLAVGFLIWWLWKKGKGRAVIFGTLFFFVNVIFVLQVFGAGQGFMADRFTYVSYFGFFVLAAYGYDLLKTNTKRRMYAHIAAGIVFAFFAVMTYRQINVWKNGETLWTHVLKVQTHTVSLPISNRANYYRSMAVKAVNQQGTAAQARDYYEKSMKDYNEAIRINPNAADQYNSRGKTQFDMAMSSLFDPQQSALLEKALADFNKALTFDNLSPNDKAEYLANRGGALAASNQFETALKDLSTSLELNVKNQNAYLNRSLVYVNLGQYEKAIGDYTKYLGFVPYDGTIYYERGLCRRLLNDAKGALSDQNRAIELDPTRSKFYLERARVYAMMGNKEQARQDAKKAMSMGAKIDPAEAVNLGI